MKIDYMIREHGVSNNGNAQRNPIKDGGALGVEDPTEENIPGKEEKPTGTIYGVKIDTSNPHPYYAVEYIESSQNFLPAATNNREMKYGSWKNKFPFNKVKPCLLNQDGDVIVYLDPNDYSKTITGEPADLTGANGYVMIEFPKVYWHIQRSGNYIYVRYSDVKINDSYKCFAHMRNGYERDKLYIAAFPTAKESGSSGIITSRSIGGANIEVHSLSVARTKARANGLGWDLMSYNVLTMLQVLYLTMYKTLNSQAAMGAGPNYYGHATQGTPIVPGSDFYSWYTPPELKTNTGSSTYGLFSGEQSSKGHSRFCGIEDLFGAMPFWIDGIKSDSNGDVHVVKSHNNFGQTSNYTKVGSIAEIPTGTYTFVVDVAGTMDLGFTPIKALSGASNLNFCDSAHRDSGINQDGEPMDLALMWGGCIYAWIGRKDSLDLEDYGGMFSYFFTDPSMNQCSRIMYLQE